MFRSKRIVHHPATLLGCSRGFSCLHGAIPSRLEPVKEIKAVLLFFMWYKNALHCHIAATSLGFVPTLFISNAVLYFSTWSAV